MSEFSKLNGYDIKDKKAVRSYDNVTLMIADETLKEGQHVKTKGYYEINDGGSAEYLIVSTLPSNKIYEELDNNLYGELLINDNTINVKQLGLSSTNENNSSLLQSAINKYDNITFFFPYDNYEFSTPIDLNNKTDIKFIGQCDNLYNQNSNSHLIFKSCDGFTNVLRLQFENLSIDGYDKTGTGISGRFVVKRCHILRFNNALDGRGYVSESSIYQNNYGLIHCVDSRIINNQIYNNSNNGISLGNGNNDNIITNNKIEWNGGYGISLYQCANNLISNNIFDRNTEYGIRCIQSTHSIINNNVLRRNYVSDTESNSNAQIRFEGNEYVTLSNNITRTGNSKDDNTGITIPYCSIYISNNTDCILLGNDLSGGTKDDPVVFYLQDRSKILYMNDSIPLIERIITEKKTNLASNVNVNAEGNTTVTMNIDTLERYNFKNYFFEVFYRNGNNNDYRSQMIKVQVYKRTADSDYTMVVSIDTSTLGDLGITGAVSYDSETSQYSLTLTFTNNSTTENLKVTCNKFNLI